MAKAMNQVPGSLFPAPFKPIFSTVEVEGGQRTYLRMNGGDECDYVSEDVIPDAILRFCCEKLKDSTIMFPQAFWTHKDAVSAFKYWRAITTPIKEPKLFRFLTDPGSCFRRIPFDPKWDYTAFDLPIFEEILSRCDNPDALCAWIGSVFVEESPNYQYLFLSGDGQDSKGTLFRLIHKILGRVAIDSQPPESKKDNFWTSAMLGRRICIISDLNNTACLSWAILKNMTGGDHVPIELKYGAKFSKRLNCKVMIGSNRMPDISSSHSDRRRIVICQMEKIPCKPKAEYESNLYKEAPAIVAYCINKYEEATKDSIDIYYDQSKLNDIIDENESSFSAFLDGYLELDEKCSLPSSKLQELLKENRTNNRAWKNQFISYLKRIHKIKGQTLRNENTGVTFWGYPGLKARIFQHHNGCL